MKKGIAVALVSGCLSACFSYGINAGKPLAWPRWRTVPIPCS
jgi:L-rhamnose-H+ transport protein